ncbi:hypothetical protein AJ85_15040 [Alkalihalobacillus alcalophilus ATCC 27647 = CGMCC 1.3604]|uniref:Uncharacterized protein n=1 Tax=Alkalihalobacillus alcalophilus ATCC 27647 = CGMCC 1.3604 TaxID=1218173 RepID=A0A4S4JX59_ALKAL|nr:hypothetical protein AJ85_15040 [Alkalihalobacillus alcalophilus ATCC 27647 = CGMCC 1.3604]
MFISSIIKLSLFDFIQYIPPSQIEESYIVIVELETNNGKSIVGFKVGEGDGQSFSVFLTQQHRPFPFQQRSSLILKAKNEAIRRTPLTLRLFIAKIMFK